MRSRSQGLGPQRPSPLAATICRNLDFINKNEIDLDGLEEQTSRICADLGKIDTDETNIGELLEQTNEIVDNLTRIEQSEKSS
jgi:hypothetical protein